MRLVPNSNSDDAQPLFYAPGAGKMKVRAAREFNTCHAPGGSARGGQFCSRRSSGDAAVGMGRHFKQQGINPESPPDTWYPAAGRESRQAERDPAVKAAADAIRRDPQTSPLEKAYAGLIAQRELRARAAMEHGDDSWARNIDAQGRPTAERQKLHMRIIEQYVADQEAERGGSLSRGLKAPTVMFIGGVSGAGKSSVVGDTLRKPDALLSDGDVFKDYLKRMDPSLRNATASDLQRESGYLSDLLVLWGASRRMNVVVDGTMKTLGDESAGMDDHLAGRLSAFKRLGYRTEVRFVDITIEQSVQRVLHRFLSEVNTGGEGRFVPPSFVRRSLTDEAHGTKPRRAFFGVRGRRDLVDAWRVVDGWSGRKLGEHGSLIDTFAGN